MYGPGFYIKLTIMVLLDSVFGDQLKNSLSGQCLLGSFDIAIFLNTSSDTYQLCLF